MSRKLKALVCIAHPDDEVLFFGGLIAAKNYDWTIICVTDANADQLGAHRKQQFKKSCQLLGVKKIIFLDYPDVFDKRLDTSRLTDDLKSISDRTQFKFVFTHGVLGEYGHQHHQDVCFATYKSFLAGPKTKIFSVAYNLYPDIKINLNEKLFKLKTKILWKIYASETRRLLNFLPATSCEGFTQVTLKEVEEIYSFIIKDQNSLNKKNLKTYLWLYDYIASRDFELKSRPF